MYLGHTQLLHSFFMVPYFFIVECHILKSVSFAGHPLLGDVPFCWTSRLPLAFAATDNVSVSYLVNLSLPACTSVYVSSISGLLGLGFFLMFLLLSRRKKKEKEMCDKKKKKCKM